jgi:hypothetical protein
LLTAADSAMYAAKKNRKFGTRIAEVHPETEFVSDTRK